MNASVLVDLLLELNVINVQDIDNEINRMAGRLTDPRAKRWFKRVPRFFLINIERLLKEPLVAKAEPRKSASDTHTQFGSNYYADPKGGWRAGQAPPPQHKKPGEPPTSPLPVREQYDPKEKTYTTKLHEPAAQHDIDQSFSTFKPAKAKAKSMFGRPPAQKDLQPWMTAPEASEKEFHHFNPIQARRRELFIRLGNLVNYLNYQASALHKKDSEDPEARSQARAAALLFGKLDQMKTDDIVGFRSVMQDADSFDDTVKERPWEYTKDGQQIAAYNDLVLRKVLYPQTAIAMASAGGKSSANLASYMINGAEAATQNAPLYFVMRGDKPYVAVSFAAGTAYTNEGGTSMNEETAKRIAPLFADRDRFPMEDIMKIRMLARQVNLPDQSEVVYEFENGWHLSQLTAPYDLAREGVLMGHCVGNDTYQQQLVAGESEFYSLRDPENRSQVTIQVKVNLGGGAGNVMQMKGQNNSTTFSPEIRDMLRAIIAEFGWSVQGDAHALRA